MASLNDVTVALYGSKDDLNKLSAYLAPRFSIIEIEHILQTDLSNDSPVKMLNFCDLGHKVHLRLLIDGILTQRTCDVLVSLEKPGCMVKRLLKLPSESRLDIHNKLNLQVNHQRQGASSLDLTFYGRIILASFSITTSQKAKAIEDSINYLAAKRYRSGWQINSDMRT